MTRPYTPITSNRVKGHFDLMIKSYPAGKLSAHFATLKPGQTLEFQVVDLAGRLHRLQV